MPIYEYHCNKCDNEFEKLVLSTSEKISCPKCNSLDISRMMSTFAFSTGGKFKSTASSSCSGCSATTCSSCGSK